MTGLFSWFSLPLRAKKNFANAQFVSVPGNHDVDCDIGPPPVWNYFGRQRQEHFFHSDEKGKAVREQRSKAFQAYSDFISSNNILGVLPQEDLAQLTQIKSGDQSVTFITINTAFFSDKDVIDKNQTPFPLHSIRNLVRQNSVSKPFFILGHHPKDWFTSETQDPLWTFLVTECGVYLHGHLHRIYVSHGNKGLVTLGFGAAYQAPADWHATLYYRIHSRYVIMMNHYIFR